MRFTPYFAAGLALVAAAPAFAQDTAPPKAFTVSGGATIVSDYRFRGISQTNLKAAVQGTATVTHESGAYISFWGSSIDDYIANGSDQELDLIAGYSHTFGGIKLDGGVLYYYYPGGGSANTDFVEPYVDVSGTYGPATLKVTAAYAPKAKALSIGLKPKEDNFYLAGDLSAGIPKTPLSISGHLGHTFGQSYLSIGTGYTDWNIGASATFGHVTAGISYVDTDKDVYLGTRNLSGAGVVASVGVSF